MYAVTCPPNNLFGLEDDGTNLVSLMRKNAKSRFSRRLDILDTQKIFQFVFLSLVSGVSPCPL